MKYIHVGQHVIPLWLVAVLLISGIFVGVLADYVWLSVTIPFEVKEPLQILHYPSDFSLFPGETEGFNITVQNNSPLNYSVVLDVSMPDVTYLDNYIKFTDEVYTVVPGQQNLFAWLLVEPNAPPIDTSLTINLKRVKPELPTLLLKEDWNTLAAWEPDPASTLVEINPPGQLHAIGGGVQYYGINYPTQFTIEFKLKVDTFGDGYATFQIYTPRSVQFLQIFADYFRWGTGDVGCEYFQHSTDNNWHVWRVTVDETAREVKVYKDGVFLVRFTRGDYRLDLMPRFVTGPKRYSTCETHWDYHYINSGIHPSDPL